LFFYFYYHPLKVDPGKVKQISAVDLKVKQINLAKKSRLGTKFSQSAHFFIIDPTSGFLRHLIRTYQSSYKQLKSWQKKE
jgi:hypothetical protein